MGKAFESIKQGLNEAIGHAKGKQAGVKVYQAAVVDVAGGAGPLGIRAGAIRGAVRRVGGDPAALGAWRP